MPVSRRLLPTLAVLLTASSLAAEVQAARPRENAPAPQTAPTRPSRTAQKAQPAAAAKPTAAAAKSPATAAKPTATKPVATKPARVAPPAKPVPEASLRPDARAGARTLRPRREPLLARHPAATCALDPLEAVGLRQHDRARESLREFYWSDMARFFESSLDLSEPTPTQVRDPAFSPTDAVLRDLPAAVRAPLAAVAGARVVDRLGEREFNRVSKLLASLGPAQVASLLHADAPTLRAYVWTWLTTTKTGGCHLGHLDLDFIEAAVGDRSVAVEHGDDLVYRSLGDYALAARARLATLDPQRFDTFLLRLTGAGEIDPLVRATAHGVLLRRAHWDTLELGLRDPSPPVRAATAVGALEMNRDKVEAALVEHAAGDPADLVTELIVGALLGVHDPHARARDQLRGPLAATRDERLVAAVTRWRGRGDPLEPLPGPQRPLRFAPGPVPQDIPETAPAQPVLAVTATPPEPAPRDIPSAPVLQDSPRPEPAHAAPEPAPQPALTSEPTSEPAEPRLPGVLDEPGEYLPLPTRARDPGDAAAPQPAPRQPPARQPARRR